MKQITLEARSCQADLEGRCLTGPFLIWGCYGLTAGLLWQLAGPNPWAQTATWVLALGAGLGLVLWMREV
jgi:hypothetical protein